MLRVRLRRELWPPPAGACGRRRAARPRSRPPTPLSTARARRSARWTACRSPATAPAPSCTTQECRRRGPCVPVPAARWHVSSAGPGRRRPGRALLAAGDRRRAERPGAGGLRQRRHPVRGPGALWRQSAERPCPSVHRRRQPIDLDLQLRQGVPRLHQHGGRRGRRRARGLFLPGPVGAGGERPGRRRGRRGGRGTGRPDVAASGDGVGIVAWGEAGTSSPAASSPPGPAPSPSRPIPRAWTGGRRHPPVCPRSAPGATRPSARSPSRRRSATAQRRSRGFSSTAYRRPCSPARRRSTARHGRPGGCRPAADDDYGVRGGLHHLRDRRDP